MRGQPDFFKDLTEDILNHDLNLNPLHRGVIR